MRSCGDCQLCCRLLPMKAGNDAVREAKVAMIEAGVARPQDFVGMLAEWDKPAGARCQHQRHHKGCAVYPGRPFGCRMWNCRWLVSDDTADLPRPDRSRYVIDIMPDFVTMQPHDGSPSTTIEVVQVWIDPAQPEAWRDPRMLAYLERRGQEGKAALMRLNNKDAFTVFPPAMSADGQFHVVHGGTVQREHTVEEKMAGIAQAKKVVFAT